MKFKANFRIRIDKRTSAPPGTEFEHDEDAWTAWAEKNGAISRVVAPSQPTPASDSSVPPPAVESDATEPEEDGE